MANVQNAETAGQVIGVISVLMADTVTTVRNIAVPDARMCATNLMAAVSVKQAGMEHCVSISAVRDACKMIASLEAVYKVSHGYCGSFRSIEVSPPKLRAESTRTCKFLAVLVIIRSTSRASPISLQV